MFKTVPAEGQERIRLQSIGGPPREGIAMREPEKDALLMGQGKEAGQEPATVDSGSGSEEEKSGVSPAQWRLILLVVALTAASVLYRVLTHSDLTHSAAMFLGVPAVLAILLALAPKARSLTGGVVKGITLFLLMVAPLLGEGYLCIVVAAPIFYGVGIAVALFAEAALRRERRKATLSCVAVLLLPMCLEGVVPQWSFARDQFVESTRIIDAPESAVETALQQSPSLSAPLPSWLKIGFPRPLAAYGGGLEVGDTRTIHFAGAEGDPPGDLVSRVAERRARYVRVDTVSDSTKLTQWLRWQSSEVEWRAVDAQHTAVTWRVHFIRELDPAWYFIPWERFTVEQAANYMIEANATPRRPAR